MGMHDALSLPSCFFSFSLDFSLFGYFGYVWNPLFLTFKTSSFTNLLHKTTIFVDRTVLPLVRRIEPHHSFANSRLSHG